jgi:hypothetical protein
MTPAWRGFLSLTPSTLPFTDVQLIWLMEEMYAELRGQQPIAPA